MNYPVLITDAAKADLRKAADYAGFAARSPAKAAGLLDKAEAAMKGLSILSYRSPVLSDPVLASWGVRTVPVGDYLLFYVIRERAVHVIRFLYKKRGWSDILK